MTKQDLLAMISPATNGRLREIKRLLTQYNFSDHDLKILYQDIMGSISKRAKKKLERAGDEWDH